MTDWHLDYFQKTQSVDVHDHQQKLNGWNVFFLEAAFLDGVANTFEGIAVEDAERRRARKQGRKTRLCCLDRGTHGDDKRFVRGLGWWVTW